MENYEAIFDRIIDDPRYQQHLDWGRPRRGHSEGTIRAHVEELERNLEELRSRLAGDEYWKLKILIHTHDTFKPEAIAGVPIRHARSHASRAREFLSQYTSDGSLLAAVQFHDEPYTLWRHARDKGEAPRARFEQLLASIPDWDLFLAFAIIDGCTPSKGREPLRWFFSQIECRVESRFTAEDLL